MSMVTAALLAANDECNAAQAETLAAIERWDRANRRKSIAFRDALVGDWSDEDCEELREAIGDNEYLDRCREAAEGVEAATQFNVSA